MSLLRGRVITPSEDLRDAVVEVAGDRITAVRPPVDGDPSAQDEVILPGLVDLHCHGGGGGSFTSGDAEAARTAADHHLRHGTTTLVGSAVTDDPQRMLSVIGVLADAVDAGALAAIHIEGPFLAAARCGAQDPAHLRDPDLALAAELIAAGRGHVRMMTVAPELPGAAELAELLTEHGVTVAVGHTDAAATTVERFLHSTSPSVVTHLFNGMAPVHHREPGAVLGSLAAAAAGDAMVELIADGVHLADDTVAAVMALIGDRVVLITDAMAAAGMGDGDYQLGPAGGGGARRRRPPRQRRLHRRRDLPPPRRRTPPGRGRSRSGAGRGRCEHAPGGRAPDRGRGDRGRSPGRPGRHRLVVAAAAGDAGRGLVTLARMQDLLAEAAAGRRGLVAMNVIQLEHAEAIVTGAEAADRPVVLQISENTASYHGALAPLLTASLAIAAASAVDVCVHLDHATSVDLIREAVGLGVPSVMYDGSALDHPTNLATTVEVVTWCHERGVSVEAELGEVGGKDGVHAPGVRTDPAEAADFVAATGVDALAVAVGSSHAMTTRDAELDDALIAEIAAAVSVPLVLHGSSGVPDAGLVSAIAAGMTKINIATHLNAAFTTAVREALLDVDLVDPRKYLGPGRAAVAAEVERLLALLS